ncbi:MAG: hypothetical protein ACI9KS_002648, partial [Sulfitobacter sp.]
MLIDESIKNPERWITKSDAQAWTRAYQARSARQSHHCRSGCNRLT